MRLSYEDPVQTYSTNMMGTVHVLEAARRCPEVRVVVNFTSDKCYENREWDRGYREDDPMGGHDPYSSSKGCAELVTAAYRNSFFGDRARNSSAPALASARAGKRIEVASEQVVASTSTDDLSRAVYALIAHPKLASGIYHLVNEGQCSWYEFTRAIVEILGSRAEVVPMNRGGRTGNMRCPLYSVLANTRAHALGITQKPWRDALEAYLRAKYLEVFERQQQLEGD